MYVAASFQIIFRQKKTENDDIYEGNERMIMSKNIKIVMKIKMKISIMIEMMPMRTKTILLIILLFSSTILHRRC